MKGSHPVKNSAYLYIISAASLWGGIGVFFNILNSVGFSQMQVVTIRVVTAAIALTLYILFKDPSMMKIRVKDTWCFAGTGIISLLMFNWCYFTAIKATSLAVAAVLLYTAPIFIMLLSAFLFNEEINVQKIAALVLTFIGCVCVAGIFGSGGRSFSAAGILTGIGSGIGYALYSIFGRYALKKGYSSTVISEYTFIFASIGSIPFSGIGKVLPLLADPMAIAGALGIGVLCCTFPFLMYTKGLARVENGKAAIMATMEPAVAAILSYILYGENLLGVKGIGILLIFASVILLNHDFTKRKHSERRTNLLFEKKS